MSGIFSRLGTAISASVHDALDRVETPESSINQLVRDNTDNVTRARTLAIEAVASEKRLASDIAKHRASIDEWTRVAEGAMAKSDEATARGALEKKIELDSLLQTLIPQHERAASNSETLKVRLKDLEQSLSSLKGKRAALLARQKGAEALRETDSAANSMLSQRDVDEKVSRVEDMVADLESRNEAMTEIQDFTHPEISLDAQKKSDELEQQLNALREKQ